MKRELLKNVRKNLVVQNENLSEMDCLRENLRMYIDNRAITLVKLSEDAGISMETLKTLIYGHSKDCMLSTVSALAKALHVTKDELTGSLDKRTALSLASYQDDLPLRSKRIIDWNIKHEIHELAKHPGQKVIRVMTPELNEFNNLKRTLNNEYMDISNLGEELISKAYFAIKIPCDFYEPLFFEGDVLILANDRKATPFEKVVILENGNISIVKRKVENGIINFYSIIDGSLYSTDKPSIETYGYVIKHIEGE